jgi:3-mercaptopyruvate sulfurtransferase SseA
MPPEFMGKELSRKPAKETLGHVPGTISLLFMPTVTGKDYLECKTGEEIKNVFESSDITPGKQTFFLCVSGCFGSTLQSQQRRQ